MTTASSAIAAAATAAALVLGNPDIFTNICLYLETEELQIISESFPKMLNMDYVKDYINKQLPKTQAHTLLYGEVQSGKTDKIMRYIKYFKTHLVKVVVMQNNLTMLAQYKNAFKRENIQFLEIKNKNSMACYNGERVILVMNNKFRKYALETYIENNDLRNYCLIMDESDQYYEKIKYRVLFERAIYVVHATATPFKYDGVKFEKNVHIRPKSNYIGIHGVDKQYIDINKKKMVFDDKSSYVGRIIEEDFLQKSNGCMLINCLSYIRDMERMATHISQHYPEIPVAFISSKTTIHRGATITTHKTVSVQKIIDKFANDTHIILIANRYSNRGINYTDSTYSRCITHQVSAVNAGTNIVNYLQKCRIFGNRKTAPEYKPILYTMGKYTKYENMKVLHNVENAVEIANAPKYKVTVAILKNLCRENNIRGFSNKRKEELIELLLSHNIPIVSPPRAA